MNALDQLKEMLTLDRKTLRIEDIAPLVQKIEVMYLQTSSKLSKEQGYKLKYEQSQATILRLSLIHI